MSEDTYWSSGMRIDHDYYFKKTFLYLARQRWKLVKKGLASHLEACRNSESFCHFTYKMQMQYSATEVHIHVSEKDPARLEAWSICLFSYSPKNSLHYLTCTSLSVMEPGKRRGKKPPIHPGEHHEEDPLLSSVACWGCTSAARKARSTPPGERH